MQCKIGFLFMIGFHITNTVQGAIQAGKIDDEYKPGGEGVYTYRDAAEE